MIQSQCTMKLAFTKIDGIRDDFYLTRTQIDMIQIPHNELLQPCLVHRLGLK